MPPLKLWTTDPIWLTVAARELGQHELAGLGDNPRIVEYFTATNYGVSHDSVAWCSAFVCWVMRESGYQSTKSAAAVSWLQYGRAADSTEERGSIAVIRHVDAAPDPRTGSQTGNHVGFLLSANRTHFVLLGGNQHDSVSVSTFAREAYKVRTLRWPRACDRIVSVPQAAA